jgi:hypothetical protein
MISARALSIALVNKQQLSHAEMKNIPFFCSKHDILSFAVDIPNSISYIFTIVPHSHICAHLDDCLSTQVTALFDFRSQTQWLWRCGDSERMQSGGEFTLHHQTNSMSLMRWNRVARTTDYRIFPSFPLTAQPRIERTRCYKLARIPNYKKNSIIQGWALC